MKKRFGIAQALLGDPGLIIVDEPTAGLDASLKAGVVNLMLETRASGTAYLFISHDLHLIRYVADRIMVMLRGRLVEIMPREAFETGHPHHPYTDILLHSMAIRRDEAALDENVGPIIDNESLSLEDKGGCFFYERCPRARKLGARAEVCRVRKPGMISVGSSQIACHFSTDQFL
jgi:peptide/nickel transport system ATP-binding protein